MNFDYHIMMNNRVVDRATTEQIAIRVCVCREEILGRAFRGRMLSIFHVPSDTVVARHKGKFLPPVPRRGGNRRLTEEKVLTIRRRRAAGEMGKDLAKEFGVGQSTISAAVHGRTWTASFEDA